MCDGSAEGKQRQQAWLFYVACRQERDDEKGQLSLKRHSTALQFAGLKL